MMQRNLVSLLAPSFLVLLSASLPACTREGGTQPGGEILYHRYCASCHGPIGKGDGPVAPSLKTPPPDLTTLARRWGERFNERELMAIIDGRRLVTSHGPREMPVWGAIFDEELEDRPHTQYTSLLRGRVLSDFIRSIQQEK